MASGETVAGPRACARLFLVVDLSLNTHTCAPFVGPRKRIYVFSHHTRRMSIECIQNVDLFLQARRSINYTTFSNGSLGSRIDEERSELR